MLMLLNALKNSSRPAKGFGRVLHDVACGVIILLAAFWGIATAYFAFWGK